MTVTGGSRLRAWATTIVVLLSTLLSGILPTSMVWPGSPTVCADVAVTVAVNPDHTPTAHLLDYRITAGQSHGPPAIINGSTANGHTYYVLAGDTPVLAHNCKTKGHPKWCNCDINKPPGVGGPPTPNNAPRPDKPLLLRRDAAKLKMDAADKGGEVVEQGVETAMGMTGHADNPVSEAVVDGDPVSDTLRMVVFVAEVVRKGKK